VPDLVERVKPAVVLIVTDTKRKNEISQGTGFLIRSDLGACRLKSLSTLSGNYLLVFSVSDALAKLNENSCWAKQADSRREKERCLAQ